eukprot:752775-Hanusia_phi.AAC.4
MPSSPPPSPFLVSLRSPSSPFSFQPQRSGDCWCNRTESLRLREVDEELEQNRRSLAELSSLGRPPSRDDS